MIGYAALAFNIVGAVWLASVGELKHVIDVVPWSFYLVAAILGIVHNRRVENRSMVATFTFFLVMNVVAVSRVILHAVFTTGIL